jgi:hypothetical protein
MDTLRAIIRLAHSTTFEAEREAAWQKARNRAKRLGVKLEDVVAAMQGKPNAGYRRRRPDDDYSEYGFGAAGFKVYDFGSAEFDLKVGDFLKHWERIFDAMEKQKGDEARAARLKHEMEKERVRKELNDFDELCRRIGKLWQAITGNPFKLPDEDGQGGWIVPVAGGGAALWRHASPPPKSAATAYCKWDSKLNHAVVLGVRLRDGTLVKLERDAS